MLLATLAMFGAAIFIAFELERHAFDDSDQVIIRLEEGALVLGWRGEVRAPMALRFAEAFETRGDDASRIIVELNSPGGQIAQGREVIELIERMKKTHEVDTRVLPKEFCFSMCVPIFLQGERRIAARSSLFMFHEPMTYDAVTDEVVKRPAFERNYDTEQFYRRYLANSPMSPEWGERLKDEWRGKEIWKTGEELVEEGSNIVTELR
jgi:ATP-dependent protease ClpP protease subunit